MDKDLLDRIERASLFYAFSKDLSGQDTFLISRVETLLEDGRVVNTIVHTLDWRIKSTVEECFPRESGSVPCLKEVFLKNRGMAKHWDDVANSIRLTAEHEGVPVHDWNGDKTFVFSDATRMYEEADMLRRIAVFRGVDTDWLLYNIMAAELVLVKAREELSGWTATDGRTFKRSEYIGLKKSEYKAGRRRRHDGHKGFL